MRSDDGYTLTEMLVVIAIIGLLAAVLTPSVIGQLGRARVKAASLQLQTTASALEMFRDDVGRYPTHAEGLAALTTAPQDVEGWIGPYLKDAKASRDPWNQPLVYQPEGDTFRLESLGADRRTGGRGAAADLKAP